MHSENPIVREQVEQLLARSASFHDLDVPTRRALTDAMTHVTGYLAANPGAPLATQLAPPELQQRLARPQEPAQPPQPVPAQPAPAAQQPAATPQPAGGGGPTGRVGEVARATLSAIDFPSFVASLIQGTFQAIVDSSIQQMQAYAELLKNVATTVDRFMDDNISDATARDYLADQHPNFLTRDASGGSPQLRVIKNRKSDTPVPSFFKDLGFESPDQIDEQAMEETIVPAARRSLAERRQQTLATMVLLGINRVLVDSGEISAKLMFHIDASESMAMRFDQTKTTTATMAGRAGSNPFSAQALMVNTASINAQNDMNVRADLTGQVKVLFRSESFPLERFADSAAIQLINSNARVPAPAAAPEAGAAKTAPAANAPAPAAATAPPAAPPPKAPTTQELAVPDPWSAEA